MKANRNFDVEYSFEDVLILFQKKDDLMINATELAKKYGKQPSDYLRLERVKELVICLRKHIVGTGDSPYEDGDSSGDYSMVYVADQHSGTYMHRLLALDFAGWLNPDFQIWMLQKIEYILYGYAQRQNKEIFENVERKRRLTELEKRLTANEDYQEILRLQTEINQSKRRISKGIAQQTDLLLRDEPETAVS